VNINKTEIIHRLIDLKTKTIGVFGDLMLDRYLFGECERISPEAPVPVVSVSSYGVRPGGASNVASNLVSLGYPVCLSGVTGRDSDSAEFVSLLNKHSIDTSLIICDSTRPTSSKTRVIARNQQMVRIDNESVNDVDFSLIEGVLDELLKKSEALIISDYGKGVVNTESLTKILDYSRKNMLFTAVDPKEKHFELYSGLSLITNNVKEAGYAVGFKVNDNNSVKKAAELLLKRNVASNILITRGADGMTLFSDDGSSHHFPALARKVFDVTGAGDTVISVVTAMVASGFDLSLATFIANYAAGISVSEIGTKAVTIDEIITSIKQ
jgi:D-beta-D-heptose 7-phosphate kinase/D-beta-D-heptose 1-phosphate adenosyltransferase